MSATGHDTGDPYAPGVQGRIGKVGRVDLRAHLKVAAVIRLAHIAEPVDYAEQGTVFHRTI